MLLYCPPNQRFNLFYSSMHDSHRAILLWQDSELKDQFLAKIYKHYSSVNPFVPAEKLKSMSEYELQQFISTQSAAERAKWAFYIGNNELILESDLSLLQENPLPVSIFILLLQVGEQITKETLEQIKSLKVQQSNFLVIVDKPSKKIKDSKVKEFQNSVKEILQQNLQLELKEGAFIEICLKENLNIIGGTLDQKLVEIVKKKSLQTKEEKLSISEIEEALKLIMKKYTIKIHEDCLKQLLQGSVEEASVYVAKKERAQFEKEISNSPEFKVFLLQSQINQKPQDDLRTQTSNTLKILLAKFNVKNIEDCLLELMEGNIEDAVLSVKKDQRKQFLSQIQSCLEFQKFLTPQAPITDLKELATKALLPILQKFKVVEIDGCMGVILDRKINEALIQVKRMVRPVFKQQIENCTQLQQYWSSLVSLDSKEQLKQSAQRQIKQVLKAYNVSDVQICLEAIMSDKLESIIEEIPKKKQSKFKSDIEACDSLRVYFTSIERLEANLKQQAQKVLALILQRYDIEEIQESIKQIFDKKVDEVVQEAAKSKRVALNADITNCPELIKYQESLIKEKMQSRDLKSQAEAQIKQLLQKYSVAGQDFLLEGLMRNSIHEVISQISTDKREDFTKDFLACRNLHLYFESIELKPNSKVQSIQLKLKEIILSIVKKYNSDDQRKCLENVLNKHLEAAQSSIKRADRPNFLKQISDFEELNQYWAEFKDVIDEPQVSIMERSLKDIIFKFQVKQPNQCLQMLLQRNVGDACLKLKKEKRKQFSQLLEKSIEYQQFLVAGEKEGGKKPKLQQTLLLLMKRYKIVQDELCVRLTLEGDINGVLEQIISPDKQAFKQEILGIQELNYYWNSKNKSIKLENNEAIIKKEQDIKEKSQKQQQLNGMLIDIKNKPEAVLDEAQQIQIQQIQKIMNEDYYHILPNIEKEHELEKMNSSEDVEIIKEDERPQIRWFVQLLEKLSVNVDRKSIYKIINELHEGSFQTLKNCLEEDKFFEIKYRILAEQSFSATFRQNQQKFINKIPYFFFFPFSLSNLEEILNMIVGQEYKPKEQNSFINHYIALPHAMKLQFIERQVKQMKFMDKFIKNKKKLYALTQILEEASKSVALFLFLSVTASVQQKLNEWNLDTYGVEDYLTKMTKQMIGKTGEQLRQFQQDKIQLQKLLNLQKMKNLYFSKISYKSSQQHFLKSAKSLIKGKSLEEVSDLESIHKSALSKLQKNQYLEYLRQKLKELKFITYVKITSLNDELIDSLKIQITLDNSKKKILLDVNEKGEKVYKLVAQQFGQNPEDILLEFEFKDHKSLIFVDTVIEEKPRKIKCIQLESSKMIYTGKIKDCSISKKIEPDILKQIFVQKLRIINPDLQSKDLVLYGNFEKEEKLEINQKIENTQFSKGQLKLIEVVIKVKVLIYFETECLTYQMLSFHSIDHLKRIIQQTKEIPVKSQSILYTNEQRQEQLFAQKIEDINQDHTSINLTLISKMNLEHYGFHQNYPLSYQDYSQFFIDKESDLQDMVNSCFLKKEEQKNFFNQLIKFLYSAVKRKFPFTHITDQVKSKYIDKNAQQIWSGGDFNQYFLVYYILYNAESKLKIELMNILRSFIPLPLYFRTFKNINSIQDEWKINEDIIWLLHTGLCITSMGLHTENAQHEKGKTYLNNQLFYTNFQEKSMKHSICEGCPEIYLKVLSSIIPINLIDIPSQTPAKNIQRILQITNVLIIHSWKPKSETERTIKEIKKKYNIKNVICFLRDSKNKEETINKVKNIRLLESCLELHNLQQYAAGKEKIPFIKLLREKVWEIHHIAYQKQQMMGKSINKLFHNRIFDDFNKITKNLYPRFFDMKIVFTQYEEIKEMRKSQDSKIEIIQKAKRKACQKGMAKQFTDLLIYIKDHKQHSQILMLRFRQVLKETKNKWERKYLIINQHKKKLMLINIGKDKKQVIKQLIDKAIQQISELKMMKEIQRKEKVNQMIQQLSNIFDYFENEIKSMFFTIEYAWRQIQYLTTLNPSAQLGNGSLLDFLIDIKRKEISNSQPFEILDGDLLEMPKNIIKKVFEGIPDKVAVITILGPQSSGKSTLLNFLFGCDFGTSEGRCTRGVYGTYFKFANVISSNCEGIFLIDTEGLFATLNKKDAVRRIDFDSKLVLFCLAVSDFVMINTKGNLDSESTRILKSSMERFAALTEENLEWPEIYLILNQNNSGNLLTSEADINKLREIFSGQNSFSLNQAYNLVELTKKQISMLPEDENLVKREPREEFSKLTNQLQQSLMGKIESKHNFKPIGEVVDLMQRVWSTIEAFPDLGKSVSKKIQEIENRIKDWRITRLQSLRVRREEIFNRFKETSMNQKKCQQEFVTCIQSAKLEFKRQFASEKDIERLSDQEKMKLQLEEQKLELAFQSIRYELNCQIKDLQKDRLAEKCKSEGSEYEKEAIRIVKKIQRQSEKQLSNEEKQKYFDQAFKKTLDKIQQISAPEKQLQSYFERILDHYTSAMKTSSTGKKGEKRSAGIPKPDWKRQNKMSFRDYSRAIRQKIFELIGCESFKYIEFRQNPPTQILDKSSKTDAKLQYFSMRKYFEKKKIQHTYFIPLYDLKQSLKFGILKRQFDEEWKQITPPYLILNEIFCSINLFFEIKYNFKIQDYYSFRKYYQYYHSFFIWKFMFATNPDLKIVQTSKPVHQKCRQKYSYAAQPYISRFNSSQQDFKIAAKLYKPNNYNNQNKVTSEFVDNSHKITQLSHKDPKFIFLQKYLDMKLIAEKFDKSKYNNGIPPTRFIQSCIKQIINWENISNTISNHSQTSYKRQQISKRICENLNQDFRHFGLAFTCPDIIEIIVNPYTTDVMSFQRIQKINSFDKQIDCQQMLKKLNKLDGTAIRNKWRVKSHNYSFNSRDNIQLVSYGQERFEVLEAFKDKAQLHAYIADERRQILLSLKQDGMRQFVFSELKNDQIFEKFFDNIDKIIKKSPDFLTLQTVTSIFVDVNQEIIEFNNDLNQVSQKLTLLFSGYAHLYAIYFIWKKISDVALKEANKPYYALVSARERQFQFFLKETSNDDNIKSEGESDRFMSEALEFFRHLCDDHKVKMNKVEEDRFKHEYSRQVIQQKIDRECFSTSSHEEDWINYLENPAKVIADKYESLIIDSLKSLSYLYNKSDKVYQLLKQFRETVGIIFEKFKQVGITQDLIHTNIFSLIKKADKQVSVADNEVMEIINSLIMNYLLDLMIGQSKPIYEHDNFGLQINPDYQDIKNFRSPTPLFKELVRKLRDQKMSVTRLFTFVQMIDKKLNEKKDEKKEGYKSNKFQQNIKELLYTNEENQNHFRSLVTVKICKELCPCCQRICGVEQAHTNKHECKYGHQMRALGGVKLSNNEASVIRCEDVQLMSPIEFNGKKMTWKQFKQDWQNRAEGSWNFSDLKADINKQLFLRAWDICGQVICNRHGMTFVRSNAVEEQMLSALGIQPVHYIFAIDDSGSMSGSPWSQLMISLGVAIQTIQNQPESEKMVKISILLIGSSSLTHQQNVLPSQVNLNIHARFGGTDFASTFDEAYKLMELFVSSAKIKFVCMTDGGCSYPSREVSLIKALRNRDPKKIEYYGIQFQSSGETMKLISSELEGKNSISYTGSQLTNTYIEIINRK